MNKFLQKIKEWHQGFVYERLSSKESASFAKRLSMLAKAGIPMLESLQMICDQTHAKRQKNIFNTLKNDVANGQRLSKSMAKFPYAFSSFAINIIKIGESSGTLSTNLMYLADELKKSRELKSKAFGSMIYPVVITVATLGITTLLIIYIFPKIIPIFTSLRITLPLSTRIMLSVSNFLIHWGILFLILIILLFIAIYFIIKSYDSAKAKFDSMLLWMPIVGHLVRIYNLASTSRILGLLLKSGTNLLDAMPITADCTSNIIYKVRLHALTQVVERGEKISTILQNYPKLFPDIMVQMIAVGERSGGLSDTLVYLSEMYDGEVSEFTKNLSGMIEPALMIFMGILVGFVAISVITPVYSITQHLPMK